MLKHCCSILSVVCALLFFAVVIYPMYWVDVLHNAGYAVLGAALAFGFGWLLHVFRGKGHEQQKKTPGYTRISHAGRIPAGNDSAVHR